MTTFSQKSEQALKRVGLTDTQITLLQNSQTFVTQLNNHTEQANVNVGGDQSYFNYQTEQKYGDIQIASSNPMGQLDTLMHELGHANNVDMVQRVDWPTSPVDYPNATDLSMSEYIYNTTLNEGAAELNRNEIINELNQQGVLNEFPGLNMDSHYDPNKSRDEMIKELGENYVDNPNNIPSSYRNTDPKYGNPLNYRELYGYDWMKKNGFISDEQESRMTNQDIVDLMKKIKLFDNGLNALEDIQDWIKKIQDWLGDKFNEYFGLNRNGNYYVYDPLVLDLDGDGVELISENNWNGVLFDFNGNGIKTVTQWVSSNDGLLVWDRNGNGKIDNGSELFSEDTIKISANDEFFIKQSNFQVA